MGGMLNFPGRDIAFSDLPFGAVDGLILSELAMCDVWEKEGLLQDLQIGDTPVSNGFQEKQDRKLLSMAGTGRRYGSLRFTDFTVVRDGETQFAALTFHLPDSSLFIAFRGTDRSLTGWREDCRMTWEIQIPSQREALRYLERVAEKYPGPLRIGGHSKGGNLSMYAAAGTSEGIRQRITDIYNFDGPGLSDGAECAKKYELLGTRLHFFMAQGSLIAHLMTRPKEYRIIRSGAIGFLQHNPYTWQLEGTDFRYARFVSRGALKFAGVFHQWIAGLDMEARRKLVDTLFSVLSVARADSFGGKLWSGLIRHSGQVRSEIRRILPEEKQRMKSALFGFFRLFFRKQRP